MTEAGLNVGVIGATGYVGGRLVPALLDAGHRVRCLARTPGRLDEVPWRADVEVATANVLDWSSLYQAFAGLDAVYYLVHAMGHARRGSNGRSRRLTTAPRCCASGPDSIPAASPGGPTGGCWPCPTPSSGAGSWPASSVRPKPVPSRPADR